MNRILFIIISQFFSQSIFAQFGGRATYEFLTLPVSARVAALGGNATAIYDGDINLVHFNPALINGQMSNNLNLSYINYFSDITYGYISYSNRIKKGFYNAGIQYISYGKFVKADANGDITGEFTAGEYVFNTAYAQQLPYLDSSISVGANLKFLYSTFEQYQSFGLASDIGAIYYNPKYKLGVALTLMNVGTQISTFDKGNREPTPFNAQLGISKQFTKAPIRFSMVYENLQRFNLTYLDTLNVKTNSLTGEKEIESIPFHDKLLRHIVVGAEIFPTKNLFFRAGFNYRRRQELKVATRSGTVGLSWGIGFRISKFHLSYGRAIYHLAGPSNHITITTNLSSFSKAN
ncbi:MAG: type IX secretion system protein PorQ [Bacteroidia bacterium]